MKSTSERETFVKEGPAAECWVLFEQRKSAPGKKQVKMTRLKSRRREQGTEVKLCPLCLNMTERALKEVQFNSAANRPAAHAQQGTQQRKQRRAGLQKEPDCTEVKGNLTSSKEARRAT